MHASETTTTASPNLRSRARLLLIPLTALLAIFPLLLYGCSCGHDLPFHLQSWLEAAQQMRHGAFYPQWAFSPAFQAGEPRFVFYPPLSWMLGAGLTSLLPVATAPVIFVFLALTLAGFAMHRLAREFASPTAALAAACVYMVNPYMLFNAHERSANAELLAAAWIPLLLLAALRQRPRVLHIALTLTLLWLTNAPSAVMGSYAFALLAFLRVAQTLWPNLRSAGARTEAISLALRYVTGTALGLALAAFYLVPAAFERRFVQVDMAIIPNLRFQDNFLFSRTAFEPHNVVTHTVSVLAVALLLATAALVASLWIKRSSSVTESSPQLPLAVTLLTLTIAFLLFPLSTPIWAHLPELKFLQFPWRLLTILAPVAALALALVLDRRLPRPLVLFACTLAAVLTLSSLGSHLYRQACEPTDKPTFALTAFNSSHGVLPTDEYTPTAADNDILRSDDPGFWLAPDKDAPAPNTIPNPGENNPDFDGPIPFAHTLAARAPQHLTLTLSEPEILILNLRDFPDWQVTLNHPGQPGTHPAHLQRDDGLLAFALPAGPSTIDITWQRTRDQQLGDAISLCAFFLLALALPAARVESPLNA